MNNLTELSKQIFEANKAKGFWDKERNVGEMLMLVTSELGEAIEAHRKSKFANLSAYFENIRYSKDSENSYIDAFKLNIKGSFEEEIADAIIRLLDMSGGLNIDIGKHIEVKLQYNATRTYKHGKKY